MLCADCGCLVDRGIRTAVCGDPECCCAQLPVREADAVDRPEPQIHDDPAAEAAGSVASHRTTGTALHRLSELDSLAEEPSGFADVVHGNDLEVEVGTELRRSLPN